MNSCSVISGSLRPHGLYSPWNFPGQNTGVGNLSLLQGIIPTQGLNPGLLHWRQILYQLSHRGSPRVLEWVGEPFCSGSSRPRNRTGVSCIAGGFPELSGKLVMILLDIFPVTSDVKHLFNDVELIVHLYIFENMSVQILCPFEI